ncbi:hypothetical protein O0I10_011643 [Lichtheimia ornata]|uniref:Uncharacterized protein n=1 Tax=Lichtheimia ornata TaxID=688661 RepID=A0AAD7USD0_9FUNG|nr:uncharacterized protein O0I10_011643 [Lichtheimia ornata]KAJ8652698.1 hypothetical protein O0I10_011643 [Lichtheimia ornata]
MTTEDNVYWYRLLKPSNVTVQHGNDGNRIAAANETVQRTLSQLVQVLNERAKLFANSAQFEAALRDAAAIRTVLPFSGLGYLATGDVYCQQGRYAAAISMYDQGLRRVPEIGQYYQQLHQQREKAVTNSNKRVDFISRLPLDIVVTNIIPRVERKFYSYSSSEYLYVSRTWQERFLQQPNGLAFDFGKETATFKRGHDQLVRFAPYVQKLKGKMMEDAELEDLFSRGRFSNLRNLDLCCSGTTLRHPLVNGLRLIADSLTHLAIHHSTSIQLRDILESCPNLVSLTTTQVDAVVPMSPSSRYPKLKNLALYSLSDNDLTHGNMVDVLSRFPSLLSLEVLPMPESSVLPILHEHCPYLQRVCFGVRDDFIDNMNVQPLRKGIRRAYLGEEDNDIAYRQDDLIQFLYHHRKSLETIDIGVNIDDCYPIENYNNPLATLNGQEVQQEDNQGDDGSLQPDNDESDSSFMQLINLRFSNWDFHSTEAFLTWLVVKAPNLKAIHLPQSHLHPRIAKVLCQSKFSKLEIFRAARREDDGVTQFLEYHIGLGEQSTLKEMIMRVDTDMAKILWLPLIFKLRCLKNLELKAYRISIACKPAWEEIGEGCHALEKLTLGVDGSEFYEGILPPLCHVPNLKWLRLSARGLSYTDLLCLLAFPSLEEVSLRHSISDSSFNLLRTHLPKVTMDDQDEIDDDDDDEVDDDDDL